VEFFANAAAIALSVLASLFTNVEAPKAQTKAAPVVSQAALPNQTEPKRFIVTCTKETGTIHLAVFRPLPQVGKTDPESERLLEWIKSAQTGTKPLAVEPWYARTDVFSAPTFRETADILGALMSGKSESL
jgi:hypothetical protein